VAAVYNTIAQSSLLYQLAYRTLFGMYSIRIYGPVSINSISDIFVALLNSEVNVAMMYYYIFTNVYSGFMVYYPNDTKYA
jgi:hypothetical protein